MNTPENPILTKSCSICGLRKPLSAFLELSGQAGAVYGNVCASCRKTDLENKSRKLADSEDGTTSQTGHKIDGKVKIYSDIDRQHTHEQAEETYHEERNEKDAVEEQKTDQAQTTQQAQKKHRTDFLEKRSFLSSEQAPAKNFNEAIAHAENVTVQSNQATVAKTNAAREEQRKTTLDFTVTNYGEPIAGEVRRHSQVFQQFKQWLGNSAPITQAANKNAAQKNNASQRDPVQEFIDKNLGPHSKGRR